MKFWLADGRMLIEPIGGMRSMIAKISGLVAALAVIGSLVVAGASATGATDPETSRILAPTGKLRVGLYPGTPTSILPDAQPDGPRGVGYDLGKEVARQLGVPFEPVVFSKNAEVLEAVKTGAVDMVFTNASAARERIWISAHPTLRSSLVIWCRGDRRSRRWTIST
jgi:polar amino acid transport system substrate-binding protein